jgi:hypothetical protein
MDSIHESSVGRNGSKKFRKLAIGVLAAAALSVGTASTVTATASTVKIAPNSHRLAMGMGMGRQPTSVRLT